MPRRIPHLDLPRRAPSRRLPPVVAVGLVLVLASTAACATKKPPTVEPPTGTPTGTTTGTTPTPPSEGDPAPPSRLSLEALGETLYPSRYVTGGMQLAGGTYTDFGKLLEAKLLAEPIAHADLDADGDLDAAVLIAANTGGSATFYDLVVVENVDGKPQAVDSVHLGDRLKVTSLQLGKGRIDVEFLGQGEEDPMCCPSQREKRAWELRSGELVPADD